MEAQLDLTLRLGPPSAYYPQAPAVPASHQFQNIALSALTQGFGSGASAGNAQAAQDLTNRLLEFQRSVSISAITNQAIPAPMEMREFCLIDIPNRRGKVGGSKKRKTTSGYVRREPKPEDKDRVCKNLRCLITDTPMWRRGPRGPKTLCNACGIKYRKGILKPKEEEGEEGTSGESSSYSA